ncbi:MAG: CocE/NonD family hydrolase [Marmoricola sp.]
MKRGVLAVLAALATSASLAVVPGSAHAATTSTTTFRIPMSDGVQLTATLTTQGPSVAAHPTVVEFSPYGPASASFPVPADYNYLLVQIRGTGSSDGSFDALGPRTQLDVQQSLRWACDQSWSEGALALAGFSASAITVYNSLHLSLPCVKAMLLKSGTLELYRDLLVPGGILNMVPGLGVLGLIGAPTLEQGPARLQRDPTSALEVALGLFTAGLTAFSHPTLDSWWQQRGFQGDVNKVPTLLIDGWFDVESRGAFQGYQQLASEGVPTHLLVVGGHDGAPKGSDDGVAQAAEWLDYYVRGVDNGVETQPAVQMLLSDGSRESYLAGDTVPYTASTWPVPGTTWATLNLSPARSASARSLNDGSLTLSAPTTAATRTLANIPSIPTNTDVPTTALLGAAGLNQLSSAVPLLTEMNASEATALTFTTAPLTHDVLSAGPLDIDLPMSSTTPGSGIWVVLTDVWPDGSSHPLTTGRLNTFFPNTVASKSLYSGGLLVQPYGDFSKQSPSLARRMYHVELWPVGNRFKAGHRIRIDIVGVSAFSPTSPPGISSVLVGKGSGAVLRFPLLPGNAL